VVVLASEELVVAGAVVVGPAVVVGAVVVVLLLPHDAAINPSTRMIDNEAARTMTAFPLILPPNNTRCHELCTSCSRRPYLPPDAT
jgi:hypothetical protein